MAARRFFKPLLFVSIPFAAIAALVVFWDWDWLIPILQARASSALGRQVTIAHLQMHFGRVTTVEADDVRIANPAAFPEKGDFARIARVTVKADVMAYLRSRQIVLPEIMLERPEARAMQTADGENNYTLSLSAGPGAKIGSVRIYDGQAHVAIPSLKADFALRIATRAVSGAAPPEEQIVVDAKGAYAGQPITGQLVGGALLSLRDAQNPYPVALQLANGATHVRLEGTLTDPLTFGGADLKLELSGADMRDLYHLTGIPIPETPAYRVAGQLNYADHKFRFHEFHGVVGSSDLRGTIEEDPGRERPVITADLASTQVDLADLGGFIGATPGRQSTVNQSAVQKQELARTEASPKLLPDAPISLPKLRAADVKLRYRGEHILGRSVPLDDLVANLSIVNGKVALEPVSFGVGRGRIAGTAALDGAGNVVRAKARVDFEHVDVARLMAATHMFGGAGAIGGHLDIGTSGNSLAQMLSNGDGQLRLLMIGGDLSALLVDLSGLELGNAILAALGLPQRTPVECMVADFSLQKGLLNTRTLLLVTKEANVHGTGSVNLRNETIDYKLNTNAEHFSNGSLHTPIDIKGPLKSPSIRPETGGLATRGGIAAALAAVMPPAAILATIEFGKDESQECAARISSIPSSERAKAASAPSVPARRRPR
ncbi:MAG: AsmA family protein [Alphaproteobacteria bacterium]|nr:AsmA family protein [Alphaproteobacteria bacterium]